MVSEHAGPSWRRLARVPVTRRVDRISKLSRWNHTLHVGKYLVDTEVTVGVDSEL